MRSKCVFALSSLLFALPTTRAEDLSHLRAELTCSNCGSYSNLMAELTDATRRPVASGPVGQNGTIDLFGVREGNYNLVIRTQEGRILHQDQVSVRASGAPLNITIPAQPQQQRPASGTVSVARLQHKVPGAAKKEYDRAENRFKAGDPAGSAEHLRKAVKIDPEYMEAHNNLGSRLMMLGDTPGALASFRRAIELDPHSSLVQSNLAIALITAGDPVSAETAARRAIELDAADSKAKYVLGLCLYARKHYTDEAMSLLSRSADQFPSARIALAIMAATTGHSDVARRSLEEYLSSGQTEHKQRAEAMLAKLR